MSNPFGSPEIAARYESWYTTEGILAAAQEKALMQWLIKRYPDANSLLELGCGTGYFSRWFESLGLRVTGIDLSLHMIMEAKKKDSLNYVVGDAVRLPFDSRSFDLAAFITTLEFIPDPLLALKEALRIARQGIVLGVINKHSRVGKQYKQSGGQIWDAAQFFTLRDLKKTMANLCGKNSKIVYRTTLWPFWRGALPLPWGGMIGMAVLLVSEREK